MFAATLPLFAALCAAPPPPEWAAELQRAADAGAPGFRVPVGEHDFGPHSLLLVHARSFALDGQGATLWFACGSGFQLRDSKSVTVRNLTIDYDPPCFAQGVITGITGSDQVIRADFNPNFARPEIGILPGSSLPHNLLKIAYWHPQSRRMLRNFSIAPSAVNNFLANSSADAAGGFSYTLRLTARLNPGRTPGVGPGSLITVHSRTDGGVYNGAGQAFLVYNSSSIVSEDIRIFGGGAMGFVEGLGEGGNTYRRMRVSRRNRRGSDSPSDLRLLSTNVDGMHSGQLRVGPLIEDCEIAFCGDDFGNIHTRIELVLRRLGERSLLMIDTEEGHTLGASGARGATLSFYHLNTFAPLGSATVAAVQDVGLPAPWEGDEAGYAANLTATLNGPPYDAAIRLETILPRAFVVNFTAPVPAAVEGLWALAQSDSRENRGAVVRGNHWHDGYARVLLFKSSGGVIAGNLFERAGGVLVEAGTLGDQHWLEGPLSVRNVSIADNVLSGCGGAGWLTDAAGASDIRLRNNTST